MITAPIAVRVDSCKALWASGTQLPELLDDNGVVDPEKVTQAVAKAKTELGIDTHKPVRTGLRSGAVPPQPRHDGWRAAFVPRSQREQ